MFFFGSFSLDIIDWHAWNGLLRLYVRLALSPLTTVHLQIVPSAICLHQSLAGPSYSALWQIYAAICGSSVAHCTMDSPTLSKLSGPWSALVTTWPCTVFKQLTVLSMEYQSSESWSCTVYLDNCYSRNTSRGWTAVGYPPLHFELLLPGVIVIPFASPLSDILFIDAKFKRIGIGWMIKQRVTLTCFS